MEYSEEILDALEKIRRHFKEETWPSPTLESLKIHVHKATDSTEEQAWNTAEKLVEDGYIVLEEDSLQPDTKLKEVKIEKFKQDIGYTEPFVLPEVVENPSKTDYAHYFTPWLVKNHGVRAIILDVSRDAYELWSFDPEERIWKNDGRQELREIASKQIGPDYSTYLREEIEERLKAEKPVKYENTGLGKEEIAVKNGVLEISNNEIRDIRREDFVTRKVPIKLPTRISEDTVPDLWREYLQEVVPSEQGRKTLQEFAGYCLMPWTCKYERGLMLLGPTDSGKSVFLDVMKALLGWENVAQESLQDLANTRWSRASLKGKLANIDHDLDPKAVKDIGMVKKLTSGNGIMAEYKHENKFKLKPRAKLLFSANRVPDRTEEDDAFYNRWLTVTFPESIPSEEQDKELTEKLTGLADIEEREESQKHEGKLEGVLAWSLIGLKRLEIQGEFTGDLDPLATKELWKEWGNSVERFISRYCIKENQVSEGRAEEEDFKVHVSTLYDLYQEFSRFQGMETESKKGFTMKLKKETGVRSARPSINGEQQRGFFGLKLKEDAAKKIREGK